MREFTKDEESILDKLCDDIIEATGLKKEVFYTTNNPSVKDGEKENGNREISTKDISRSESDNS